jgi:hypothetical protein
MLLGEKEFEQFVNMYTFRIRKIHALREDIAQLVSEGHKARIIIETRLAAIPEHEDYISRFGVPESNADFINLFTELFENSIPLYRSYLVYILSIEHETALSTYEWLNMMKELFELEAKIII